MSEGHARHEGKLLLEHRFPARAHDLCQTRSVVRRCLLREGCPSSSVDDVVLAIDEACQNIIRHAYCGETGQEIVLHISRHDSLLEVELQDFAPAVRPDCMKPRDLEDVRPGGLGTHLIQEVMDEVRIMPSSQGEGNIMRMRKVLVRNP